MNYNKFMEVISLREDILGDITYLQKHLRIIIKFHQVSFLKTVVSMFTRFMLHHAEPRLWFGPKWHSFHSLPSKVGCDIEIRLQKSYDIGLLLLLLACLLAILLVVDSCFVSLFPEIVFQTVPHTATKHHTSAPSSGIGERK